MPVSDLHTGKSGICNSIITPLSNTIKILIYTIYRKLIIHKNADRPGWDRGGKGQAGRWGGGGTWAERRAGRQAEK